MELSNLISLMNDTKGVSKELALIKASKQELRHTHLNLFFTYFPIITN